jgi:hypothetical protein
LRATGGGPGGSFQRRAASRVGPPLAIRAAAAITIDISQQQPNIWMNLPDKPSTYVITVCDKVREAAPFSRRPTANSLEFCRSGRRDRNGRRKIPGVPANSRELSTRISYLRLMIERARARGDRE